MYGAIEIERMKLEITVLKYDIARKNAALQKCQHDLRNRQGFDLDAFDLDVLRSTIDDALAPDTPST